MSMQDLNNCDRLCINWPFTANIEIQFYTSSFYRTFANYDNVFLFPYHLLLSSYTTKRVIQFKMYISRISRFQILVPTLFTKSPRTNHFVFGEYRGSGTNFARRCVAEGRCHLWHKCKINELRPVCYFGPYWKIAFCGEWSVYAYKWS